MRKKLLSILALTVLVTSTLVGCSGAPSDSSTLTIFSITEGTVLVMKAGMDSWTEATVEMPLEVGDIIRTGDDSGAEITFFDGSTIELEAGTQIEITALDTSPDTGTTTITLMQTLGTTISRVTKLLDPASTYAIETPSGVAAVRGSVMIVRIVFNDPNYEDGTVLITCVEGDICAIWNGVELHIPNGYTCVIRPDGLLELIPPNEPPQEETGDTTDGQSEDLEPGSSAPDNLPELPDLPDIVIPPTDGETPPSDGETPPDDGGTTATISIKITGNPSGGLIYIYDDTAKKYVTEGGEVTTPGQVSFELAGDHHYYIWLEGEGTTYVPKKYPDDWITKSAYEGDAHAVYGSGEDAKELGNNPFHFNSMKTKPEETED